MATPIIPGLIQDITTVLYTKLDGNSIYRLSMVSQDWNKFCHSKVPNTMTTCHYDARVITRSRNFLHILRTFITDYMYQYFTESAKIGDIDLIKILITKMDRYFTRNRYIVLVGNDKKYFMESGLQYACEFNNINIVLFLIDKKIHGQYAAEKWSDALYCACKSNNIEICKLIMAQSLIIDCTQLFELICEFSNLEIIQSILEYLTLHQPNFVPSWNKALIQACKHNTIPIIQMLINMGADDFNGGLEHACYWLNHDAVVAMIKNGATNLNSGLTHACRWNERTSANCIAIVKLLINSGATSCVCRQSMQAHITR